MTVNIGTILGGRYEIQEKIGTGGMAVVYRGHDMKLERNVTIKVMKDEFTGEASFKNRFDTEARSAARLSHPNIQSVYDAGEDNGVYYIVMEYIHGDSLKHVIQENGPFDEKLTLSIAVQMAAALSHAHKNGVIHRDIKPQNILISVDGTIKITDFGIARSADVSTATVTANAVGSVYYFSPEQARGGYVDEKSDIYSLGITIYEMLTGHVPFDGNNSVAIALKHINSDLPDIRQFNPSVSDVMIAIVKKATEKKKDDRYNTIDDMLSDLKAAMVYAKEDRKTEAKSTDNVIEAAVAGAAGAVAASAVKADGAQKDDDMTAEGTQNTDNSENGEIKVEIPGNKQSKGLSGAQAAFEKYNKSIKISNDDDYEDDDYDEPQEDGDDMRVVKNGRNKYDYAGNDRQKKSNTRKADYSNNYEDDDEFYRKKEKKTIIAAIITALIIIGVISFFGAKLFAGRGIIATNSNVTVPNFTGMSLTDAQAKATELGLKIDGTDKEYSDYNEGTVISQETAEGTKVAKGTEVKVAVSKGKKSFSMPDVVNEDKDTAVSEITSLGGAKPEIQYENSDTVKENVVMEQNPAAKTSIDSSQRIILVVSKGPENTKIAVPQFVGKDISTVKSEVTAAGLVLGTISTQDSDAAKDKVVSQSLASGTEADKGATIDFVVSSGTKPEEKTTDTKNNSNTDGTNTTGESEKSLGFTIEAPSSFADESKVSVKMLEITNGNSVKVVYNDTKTAAAFPFNVSIKGSGKAEIQLYIDNVYQWSKNVDFSEGN